MARPPSDPGLFDVPPRKRRGRGRHERSVDRAIAAARDAGRLTNEHEGAVAMLRALSRALDGAELDDAAYTVATVSRELRQALDASGLLPAKSVAAVDPFAALLDDLDTDVPTS